MSAPDSTTLEDFLNLDLLTGAGVGASASPESSAHSPIFPPTPPSFGVFETDPASFFTFDLDGDFTKPVDPLAPPPSSAPYDFFGAFANFAAASSVASASTPSTSSASPAALSAPAPSPPAPVLAIDPQLVDSPAPESPAHDEFDVELGSDDDDDGDDSVASPSSTGTGAMKAGGKGKLRKGTVVSGGIVKKSPRPEKKEDPDDWRPSPEEYKKMSSKEKRQLRNKISARNFRTRRKEYINTLEGDIAERDRLIDAIRTELGSTKSENVALREEINALKKALLSGSQGPVLPPPGPLPAVPAAITAKQEKEAAAAAAARAASPALLTPNLHKDLPTSPRLAGSSSRGFWGGSASNPASFGSFTPVHTTLIPDFPVFAGNATAILSGKPPSAPVLQENMNPALNGDHRLPPSPALATHTPAFDTFADINPFTLKTLDAYRMQLWGNLAATHRAHNTQVHGAAGAHPHTPAGLAASLRPAYFTGSSKPLATAATNAVASSSKVPLSGPIKQEEVQAVAALASQTLLKRMGSAFWDAFSGGNARGGALDADKVRRVLEGKAVVRVVDVDEPAPKSAPAPAALRGPAAALAAKQPAQRATSPQPAPRALPAQLSPSAAACAEMCSLTSVLEEGMRTLTISKKSPSV